MHMAKSELQCIVKYIAVSHMKMVLEAFLKVGVLHAGTCSSTTAMEPRKQSRCLSVLQY